jgi:hypothetical protein
MKLTMAEKKKVTAAMAAHYRAGSKKEKGVILGEYLKLTGYNRKYAIHLLANVGKEQWVKDKGKAVRVKAEHKKRKKREYPRYYDEAVKKALEKVWKTFDYQCGKLLAPFLHENIQVIRQDEHHKMDDETAEKLGKISAATIDRLLKKAKEAQRIKGTSGTVPVRRFNLLIPTETWAECRQKGPGYDQIDLVQHDGGCPAGEFCYTLTATEIAVGWTSHKALLNKAHKWVIEALDKTRTEQPTGLKGIHPDCGSEFINKAAKGWADKNGIEFTRSRPDHSNDNCYVEQKNFATVRKIVGYFRYEGEEARDALQAVWDVYDLLLNLYYPCMKMIRTERIGAKKIRRYDKAQTPMQRIMSRSDVSDEIKLRLLKLKEENPLCELKGRMDDALKKLKQYRHEVPAVVNKGWKSMSIKKETNAEY